MRPRSFAVMVPLIVAGCGKGEKSGEPQAQMPAVACTTEGVRDVVTWFGRQLQNVSLLGPDSIVKRQIRESYGPFTTQALMEKWLATPASAPGRATSSPWPDRIEIDSVRPEPDNKCAVVGRLIYVSSRDVPSESGAINEPVALELIDEGGWKVAAWEKLQRPSS